jgi:small subunit ribosomal protein S21
MVYSLRLSTDPVGSWRGSRLTKVVVEPDESFESALKRFKKQCETAGLLSEVKKRQHLKPSARRKRKALAARKKATRRERTAD